MNPRRRRTGVRWLLGTALIAVVTLGGCGSADEGVSSHSVAGPEAGAAAPGADAREGGGAGPARAGATPTGQPGDADGVNPDRRAIIYTGTITIEVPDVAAAADRAAAIATAAGGFVGADQRTIDDRRSHATVRLRVPAARFGPVVDELADLGDERSRGIDTQDVTSTVIDIDARIATRQASVERTRALLAQAKSISEIVAVESELTKRESDLAALRAQQRRLAGQTSLSTITAELLGPEAESPATRTGFLAGLESGWSTLLASARLLLTVLGALLPWAVALGLPAAFAIWLPRHRRRRDAQDAGPAPGNPEGGSVGRPGGGGPPNAPGPSR